MRTIWKFELQIVDEQEIEMPMNAIVISAQIQNGKLFVWAIVDDFFPKGNFKFGIIGTGNPLWCEGWNFISTVQDGSLVWHVFQELQ